LRKHHLHEDEVFPGLIGEHLVQAIRMEHLETLKLLDEVNDRIVNDSIKDFLKEGPEVMRMIDDACSLAANHASREDGILYFLKKLPVTVKESIP
jgi:hypothetical protein